MRFFLFFITLNEIEKKENSSLTQASQNAGRVIPKGKRGIQGRLQKNLNFSNF